MAYMQDDPALAPLVRQRLAAQEEDALEEADLEEHKDTIHSDPQEEFRDVGDSKRNVRDSTGENKHHKKHQKKHHSDCKLLEGLSRSLVRYGTVPDEHVHNVSGSYTCYQAVCPLHTLGMTCALKFSSSSLLLQSQCQSNVASVEMADRCTQVAVQIFKLLIVLLFLLCAKRLCALFAWCTQSSQQACLKQTFVCCACASKYMTVRHYEFHNLGLVPGSFPRHPLTSSRVQDTAADAHSVLPVC